MKVEKVCKILKVNIVFLRQDGLRITRKLMPEFSGEQVLLDDAPMI